MKIVRFLIAKNHLIALMSGAFLALAFAPFNFFLASVLSLTLLFFLLEQKYAKKEVFTLGFFYGFGFFLAGNYWISISLLVDAQKFAWLIPFALTLIPATLALYFGLFALSYKFLVRKFHLSKSYKKITIFAICWVIFEIFRSTLFSGFPWNLIGYVWLFDVHFAQLASIFGIYGLSFFAVICSLFPTLFFQSDLTPVKRKKSAEFIASDKVFATLILVFVVGNLLYGNYRISQKDLRVEKDIKIRLVQANIKQDIKWDPVKKYHNFLKHIDLTKSKSLDDISTVIWSETSVPYAVTNNPGLLQNLRVATPKDGILITGGLRISQDEFHQKAWNSIFIFNKDGIVESYDKHHLVPFGEYVPMQKYLPFIDKITDGAVGFSEGIGPRTIETDIVSFSPLICYEAIFSDKIIDRDHRPDLLVNLTNDAWFGKSTGPYQHFDMTRMRAIEYGIALARVANTGITAFIDPYGRVVDKIDLNEEGILDVNSIHYLKSTIYSKYGNKMLIILIAIAILIILTKKPSTNFLKKFSKTKPKNHKKSHVNTKQNNSN